MKARDTASPARHPRKWRARRILRRLLLVLAAVGVLIALLHLPPVQHVAGRLLVRVLSRATDSTVAYERFEYRLWAGEASINGLSLQRQGLTVTCPRGVVRLGTSGMRIELVDVRVIARQAADSSPTQPPGPSRPWSMVSRFAAIVVERGALELQDGNGTVWLRADGIDARVTKTGVLSHGTASVARTDIGWPGAGLRVAGARASARFEIDPPSGTLRLVEGRVATGRTDVQVTGRVDQLEPLLGSAEAWGRMDSPILAALAPEMQADGALDVRLSVLQSAAGTTGTVQLETHELTIARSGPWSGSVRSRVEGRRLLVDSLDLQGYGTQVSGTGAVSLEGASAIDVRVRVPDVAALGGALSGSRPPIASQADLDFRVQLENWKPDTLSGAGHVRLNARAGAGHPVSGRVDMRITGRRVTFLAPELNVRQARIEAEGSIALPAEFSVKYVARLPDLRQARALLDDTGLTSPPLALAGAIEIAGTLTGRLPNWESHARLSSTGLAVEGVDVDLDSALSLTPQGIRINSLVGQSSDGHFAAKGFVPFGAGVWAIEAEAANVQLTSRLSRDGAPLQARIGGQLHVDGPADRPRGRFTLDANVAQHGIESVVERAGAAVVHVQGTLSRQELVLEVARAELGGGRLQASGTWNWGDRSLDGRLSAEGVALETLPWLPVARASVTSTLSADMSASGPVRALVGRASVALRSNTFRAGAFPDVALEATSNGHAASVSGNIGQRTFLTGRLPLVEPWPLQLDIDLSGLPVTEVVRAVPTLRDRDPSVALAGHLSLNLPVFSPRDLRYHADVSRLEARMRTTWRAEAFTAKGDVHGFAVDGLALTADTGSRLQVDGHAAFDDSSPNGRLAVRGEVPLSAIGLVLPGAELEGKAEFDGRMTGSIVHPELDGTVQVAAGPGRAGRVRWSEARGKGLLHDGTLKLESRIGLMGGDVSITGSVPLAARAERQGHEIRIEATGIDFGTLLETDERRAPDNPSPHVSALVDFAARLSVPRLALDAITGEGQLTRFAASDGVTSVGLESPASWQLSNGALSHSTIRLRGGGTALDLAANVQLRDGAPATRLAINGQMDLGAAQSLLPGGPRMEGLARVDVRIDTGPAGLEVTGDAQLEGGRVVLREPPLVLNDVAGTLKASGRLVELVDLKASVGDGELTSSGTLTIPPSAQPELDLTLEFERVPLTYPEGLRSRMSGKLRLVGADGRYRVEGDAAVHRAVYSREMDRTSQSLERVNLELSALETRGSRLQSVDLAVRVRLEDGLRLENDRAQLVVDGALTVGGDLLTPEVRGSLVLREGGRIQISRAALRISQGRIDLAGFPARAPEVTIQGRTQVTGVLIEVNVTGPPDNFSLSLSAPRRPDLTQGDLASLILTGRTASAAASEGGTILAEQLAATLGDALESGLGGAVFIDIARDEDLIVQDTNPSQRLNIGVPVARRVYVIYSQALDRNAPRWIVELRPRGEVRVRFISDDTDGDAIEIAHRFSFNMWSRGQGARETTERTFRVSQVLVEGVSPQEHADLRRATGLEPGSKFDYFRGEKSARALTEALRGRGYRAATVEFSDREVAPGRVDVTFRVRRGPRLDIEWRGDDPGGAARGRAEQSWDAYFPVEESAIRLAAEMRRDLKADRYYTASVTATVTGTAEHSRAIFEVRRGPRGRRVELGFEGNTGIGSHALSAALPSASSAAFFSLLEPEGHARLGSAIRLAYAREGFLKAVAGVPRQRFDAETGVLGVTIPVEEGPLARVVELDLPEYARAPADAVPPDLKLTVGDPFHIGAYVEDRNRLASWYREQGYTEARVTSVLEPVESGLAVRFGVDPGPRARVGEIRLAREGHTRPSVVRDAMTIGPGDLIRPGELARSSQRLSETGVFRAIDIRPDPAATDAATRDVVVDLAPRDDLSLEYSVRYTANGSGGVENASTSGTSDEIQFGAAVEASNPFGFAHRYRLYGLVGGERALMGFTFDSASFLGRRWRTQVFLFDDQDRLPEIPRLLGRVRGATFQQTHRWRNAGDNQWQDRLRMLWGYTFKRVGYSDPATLQSVSGDRAGFIYSLIGDTRDSVTDPHHGLFWSVGTELALRAVGSEVNYLKLFGQVYYYVPLGRRVVWAQGYRLGVTPGDNPLLLLQGRFYAGGASSVRGFEENTLGPLTSQNEPIGGQALSIFNQELRFPLVKRLWGGVFYDAGSAFALVRELRLDAIRQSAGAGLRLMLPFGPVRFERAWVLDLRAGEARARWVFSLGHAF